MYAVRGTYDDCSRLIVELAGEVDWAFVNVNLRAYYAEGSKTLAFEIAEQLGWELPDAVDRADRLGLALHEDLAGLRAVPPARPRRGRAAAPLRRPGAGLRARRARVRRRAAGLAGPARRRSRTSLAIGAPADGDLAIATARDVERRDLRRPGGRRRRRTCRCSPRPPASSARPRPASPSARCARRPPRRDRRERPRRPARHRHRPEDAAADRGTAGRRDRSRRRRAARRARSRRRDRSTRVRDEIAALDVRLSRRSTRASRS